MPDDAKSAIGAFGGRVGQFIFCSTIDVYTKPANHYPITEGEERKPSDSFPYAANKAACENILIEAHRHGDFPLTIIRPACTYMANDLFPSTLCLSPNLDWLVVAAPICPDKV